jgi:hypothetical protein
MRVSTILDHIDNHSMKLPERRRTPSESPTECGLMDDLLICRAPATAAKEVAR